MKLRDYFATHATDADVADIRRFIPQEQKIRERELFNAEPDNWRSVARYLHADRMLAARVLADTGEPDFAERHLQLAKNVDELIDKMETHITRLQGRLLAPAARVAEVHMSRYTVEWIDGPLLEGTVLYKALPSAQPFSFASQHVREG